MAPADRVVPPGKALMRYSPLMRTPGGTALTSVNRGRLKRLRDACLVGGMALLPFSTSPEVGGVVAFGLPLLCFAAFGYLLELLRFGWRLTPGSLFGALYVVVILGFSVLAPDPVQSFARSVPNLISFAIFAGLIHELERGSRTTTEVANLLVLSTFILAAYYCLNFALAAMSHGLGEVLVSRVVGGLAGLPWGASNTVAAVLVFGVASCLLLIQATSRRAYLYALGLLCMGVALTFSRGGAVVVALVIALGSLSLPWRHKSLLVIGTLILTILAAFIWSSLSIDNTLDELISDRIETEGVSAFGGRLEIWQERIELIAASPLEWVGYYGSLLAFDGVSAHNFLLTTWIETGPVGVFAALTLLGWPLVRLLWRALSRRNPRQKEAFLLLVGLVGVLLNLMVEDPNFTQPYIVCFWLYLAMCYGEAERARRGGCANGRSH